MNIQLAQIVFQIINFSVVAGALTYLLYKPIQKILDERSHRIAEADQAAQKALLEKQNIDDLKKQSKKEAEKEAATILATAKEDAQKRNEELLHKAQEHAKAEILKFQNEWQSEKKELVKELKQQFADAVIATAEKVLNEKLDSKSHSKLIDQELAQLLKTL
jgi:F-type H+-transporting ATPase subunit b